jgi:hypothetical protein
MADKVRLNLSLSKEANTALEEIIEQTGATRAEVFKQALALLKIAHEAKNNKKHLGVTADADKLDTEIVGLL